MDRPSFNHPLLEANLAATPTQWTWNPAIGQIAMQKHSRIHTHNHTCQKYSATLRDDSLEEGKNPNHRTTDLTNELTCIVLAALLAQWMHNRYEQVKYASKSSTAVTIQEMNAIVNLSNSRDAHLPNLSEKWHWPADMTQPWYPGVLLQSTNKRFTMFHSCYHWWVGLFKGSYHVLPCCQNGWSRAPTTIHHHPQSNDAIWGQWAGKRSSLGWERWKATTHRVIRKSLEADMFENNAYQ